MRYRSLLVLLTAVLFRCSSNSTSPPATAPISETKQNCFPLPPNTHLHRFSPAPAPLVLSYVKSHTSRDEVRYVSHFGGNDWRETAGPIIASKKLFVNWADYPTLTPLRNAAGELEHLATWLQYAGSGTYEYDIQTRRAGPGGSWTAPTKKLHDDEVLAEHGFVSTSPLGPGNIQLTWLDGRNTAAGGDHNHHGGGAMTLRTKQLTAAGSTLLDDRVCDCCGTATVATDERVLVAYRDRSPEEVRDISFVTRPRGGTDWSAPRPVATDNWKIDGCPVNGPALAANASGDIAIAWYTGADEQPAIKFARYDASRGAFEAPLIVDGPNTHGRVDLQLADDGTAYLIGLSGLSPDSAAITLWTLSPINDLIETRELRRITSGRREGFPHLRLAQGALFYSTTVWEGEAEHHVEICRLN